VLIKNPQIFSAQWCKVLDVAKRWQSQLLRDTAITHLAKSDLHPSMRLMISTKYNVPEWLPDVLPELCLQRTFPPEDIALLPPSLIVPFFSAREEFRNDLVSRVSRQAVCHCGYTHCVWSATKRGGLCDYLRESLSSASAALGSSSIVEAFQEFLRSTVSCPHCTRACKDMLSACANYGRYLVRERCFPEKKKRKRNSPGRDVGPRKFVPAHASPCTCRTCLDLRSSDSE
jgi:hypothetical protein